MTTAGLVPHSLAGLLDVLFYALNAASPFNQASVVGSLYYQHPQYVQQWWWREFCRISYLGGRDYYQPTRLSIEFWYPDQSSATRTETGQLIANTIQTAYPSLLFRHSREQEWEFRNRIKRAHYFNPVRTAVNALVSHATKRGVTRDKEAAPELEEFWAGVDYDRKTDIDAFMRDGLRWAQVEGIRWACVDTDPDDGEGGKPYAYWVDPADIMDWSVGDDGQVEWLKQFVGSEATRTWDQAIKPVHTFRIWSRTDVQEYRCDGETGARLDEAPIVTANPLGRVPFEPLYSPVRIVESDFPMAEPLITDFAKGANSVFNYVSLVNDLAYKQTFSLLCIPDPNVNTLQVGTNTVFGWNSSMAAGSDPMFIAPDPEQARVILELIAATLEQMRQAFGIGRGQQEASKEKSSAQALTLENEDKRSILGDIASAAEDFEKRLAALVLSYKTKGVKPDDVPHIQYAKDFDLRAFQDEIDEFLSLRSVGLSPEVEEKFRVDLVAKKLAGMPPDELQKLLDSLKGVIAPALPGTAEFAALSVDKAGAPGQMGSKPQPGGKSGQGNGGPNTGKATGAAEPGRGK